MKRIFTCISLLLCFLVAFSACSSETGFGNSDVWNVEYIKDDFGDSTDKQYITTVIDGTYSTESTSDKPIQIIFSHRFYQEDPENGYFYLSAVRENSDKKVDIRCPATIKLKINDQVYERWLKIPGGYEVTVYSDEYPDVYGLLFDALTADHDVQVVFDDYDHTAYRFTLESGNFSEAVNSVQSVETAGSDPEADTVHTDISDIAEIDLEMIYSLYCSEDWASVESNGNELMIDTNPLDTHVEDSATVRYKNSSVYDSAVFDSIKAINAHLELSPDLADRIADTCHADGAQYETVDKIDGKSDLRIAWSFHPNKGLVVKYQLS